MSTRKVDDLIKALGVASGISKSEVSRICSELEPYRHVPRAIALSRFLGTLDNRLSKRRRHYGSVAGPTQEYLSCPLRSRSQAGASA